uniref:Uncharacterized protein n=1 Tax=viral metagenome TaxID=1070528 RepID=A0A6M3J7S1_9ZZZZ
MTTNDDTIRALAIEAVAAMQRRDLPDPEWRARVSEALDRLIEAAGSGEGMIFPISLLPAAFDTYRIGFARDVAFANVATATVGAELPMFPVLGVVLPDPHQAEILGPVVGLVAVDVVDALRPGQPAADHPLHGQSMLCHVAIADRRIGIDLNSDVSSVDVTGANRGNAAIGGPSLCAGSGGNAARRRAVVCPIPYLAGDPLEDLSAAIADDVDPAFRFGPSPWRGPLHLYCTLLTACVVLIALVPRLRLLRHPAANLALVLPFHVVKPITFAYPGQAK